LVVEVSGHPDVSLESPVGSPRVLDDPIVLSRVSVGSPSNGENSVIESSSGAIWLNVDSAAVELEGVLRSIDGDGGGSLGDLLLKIVLISLVDIGEALEGGSPVGSGVFASPRGLGGVWVASLGVDATVGDDVLEGLSHQSSVASLVALRERAIHEVLLRERDQGVGGQEVATLGRSSGRE